MTNKATETNNRLQAEKNHAVKAMKSMARRTAISDRFQKARIAALEIVVAELTNERDEARREVCRDIACRLEMLQSDVGAAEIAAMRGWDCFKEGNR